MIFTIQFTKYGDRAVAMAMLPSPPTKPTCPDTVVLAWEEKKKSMQKHVLKGEE